MLISQSIEEKDLKYYDYGALEINPEKMFNKSRFSEEE